MPADVALERAVLAEIYRRTGALHFGLLSTDCFTKSSHRDIFTGLCRCFVEDVDATRENLLARIPQTTPEHVIAVDDLGAIPSRVPFDEALTKLQSIAAANAFVAVATSAMERLSEDPQEVDFVLRDTEEKLSQTIHERQEGHTRALADVIMVADDAGLLRVIHNSWGECGTVDVPHLVFTATEVTDAIERSRDLPFVSAQAQPRAVSSDTSFAALSRLAAQMRPRSTSWRVYRSRNISSDVF